MDPKLAMKIFNVMSKTEGLSKDMEVGKGSNAYKAVSEAAVLNMIKPLLIEEKLICLPSSGTVQEHVTVYQDAYGKNKLRGITQLAVSFKVVDAETGEEADIIGFGNGADSQDKGSGKAFTYAYKTALQKTFCMFSGEDTDNTHSDEYTGEQAKVTTAQLAEVLGTDVQATIDHYNNKTSSNITELKYMKQEWKRYYYDKAKEKK